ncbi:MAG TPA: ATP-binding protein [Anaerolineae bacterium]|nr:ATP-binding protein [Anaerolineae bacterium]
MNPLRIVRVLKETVIRWRWRIVIALMLFAFCTETIEHLPILNSIDSYYIWEVIQFAILLPLLIGTLLSLFDTQSRLSKTITRQEKQRIIRRQLSGARDWEELVTIMLQLPRTLAPIVGNVLLVYDAHSKNFELAGQWSQTGYTPPKVMCCPDNPTCALNLAKQEHDSNSLYPCQCLMRMPRQANYGVYCLPLLHADQPVAMLQLFFQPEADLSKKQIDLLSDVAPKMALAVESLLLKRSARSISLVKGEERQRIARHLHDTISPDLAYLHLRLDQLSGDERVAGGGQLSPKIAQMCEVANHCYEQVRNLLADLQQEEGALDFITALTDFVNATGARAGFQVELAQTGAPRNLSSKVGRQILFITREAIRNAARHAHATRVMIDVAWEWDQLYIEVSDNGDGFQLDRVRSLETSYGLHMMQDYADELRGRLSIHSKPEAGTTLKLWVPL